MQVGGLANVSKVGAQTTRSNAQRFVRLPSWSRRCPTEITPARSAASWSPVLCMIEQESVGSPRRSRCLTNRISNSFGADGISLVLKSGAGALLSWVAAARSKPRMKSSVAITIRGM
eukprot:5704452-Prymnesium_polylepis.2